MLRTHSQEWKMKLKQKSGAKIAMTAAALIVSGATLIGGGLRRRPFKGRCFGVNGCKGQGNCKSAKNDCKGKNGCKGQGWLAMPEEDCSHGQGQFEKELKDLGLSNRAGRLFRGRPLPPILRGAESDDQRETALSRLRPGPQAAALYRDPRRRLPQSIGSRSSPRTTWCRAASRCHPRPHRARYPMVMHGVSLSIASTAPFDEDYLDG